MTSEVNEAPDASWLRGDTLQLLQAAADALGWSMPEVTRLVESEASLRSPDQAAAYDVVARLSGQLHKRRTYTTETVNGFYVAAQAGRGGEATFESGLEGMLLHRYPTEVIHGLPESAIRRFLGIGNVWSDWDGPGAQTVIDIGCGAGIDLAAASLLCGPDSLIVGVDKRPHLLQLAHATCPQASLILGDVAHLPMRVGCFDLVLANGLPPLQRPIGLRVTASALLAITCPGGLTVATVIVAAPSLERGLAEAFPNESPAFSRGMATLISGKPATDHVLAAFESGGAEVSTSYGANPYRDIELRRLTALLTVRARRCR